MWGIDSLRSATRDMASSQNWNIMKVMSSRFVLSSLVSMPMNSRSYKLHELFGLLGDGPIEDSQAGIAQRLITETIPTESQLRLAVDGDALRGDRPTAVMVLVTNVSYEHLEGAQCTHYVVVVSIFFLLFFQLFLLLFLLFLFLFLANRRHRGHGGRWCSRNRDGARN